MNIEEKQKLVRCLITNVGIPRIFDNLVEEVGGHVIEGYWTNELDDMLGLNYQVEYSDESTPVSSEAQVGVQHDTNKYATIRNADPDNILGVYKITDKKVTKVLKKIYDLYWLADDPDAEFSDEERTKMQFDMELAVKSMTGVRIPGVKTKYCDIEEYYTVKFLQQQEETKVLIDFLEQIKVDLKESVRDIVEKLYYFVSDYPTIGIPRDYNGCFKITDIGVNDYIAILNLPLLLDKKPTFDDALNGSPSWMTAYDSRNIVEPSANVGVVYLMSKTGDFYAVVIDFDFFATDSENIPAISNQLYQVMENYFASVGKAAVVIDDTAVVLDLDLTYAQQGYDILYRISSTTGSPDDELIDTSTTYPKNGDTVWTYCAQGKQDPISGGGT